MKLHRLYVRDFMCYETAYLDFSQFSRALIVGKKENQEDVSNGVGKTTLFRAIEYALFNHADITLENILRDETETCNATVDFWVGNQEYRVSRSRTKKGITDLTLYKRTAVEGSQEEAYHTTKGDIQTPIFSDIYWTDISGRRSADTEKELTRLIRVNIKSFRIFVHFMQHDFTGLTTATPEKRKAILRDALGLAMYAKLEKAAKEKSTALTRELDKFDALVEALGDPDQTIQDLKNKQISLVQDKEIKQSNHQQLDQQQNEQSEVIKTMQTNLASLEEKFASLLVRQSNLQTEKNRLDISVKEYQTKKNNILTSAKELSVNIKQLEDTKDQLAAKDFSQLETWQEQMMANKEKIAQLQLTIQNDMLRADKLKRPIPNDGECEECRQPITQQHRASCQQKLDAELTEKQSSITANKRQISSLQSANTTMQQSLTSLTLAKQHLEDLTAKIAGKKKERNDKRAIHDEYKALLNRFSQDAKSKEEELSQVISQLAASSLQEAELMRGNIQAEKTKLSKLQADINLINKELAHLNNGLAIIEHDLTQKIIDKDKRASYQQVQKDLRTKLALYPSVIQAFSSAGIPSLIVQNVLDDLQIEANALLAQLKPGIQLSFMVEKTKADGTEADTLDINYSVAGKKRYYEQLSGAQQLAVSFSLKMGLSFLLQKMMGVDIKFLLLDEIDQSLDKASVDAFAEIVKFFQRDYTVLVITHNDRLKDKFTHAILVEQDTNMVSRARVVSSW